LYNLHIKSTNYLEVGANYILPVCLNQTQSPWSTRTHCLHNAEQFVTALGWDHKITDTFLAQLYDSSVLINFEVCEQGISLLSHCFDASNVLKVRYVITILLGLP